jgi:DNA-binding SARP family transcriptional activator
LLVNANRVVSVSDCIEELWEQNPPISAVATLQTYVMQLRRLFRATRDSRLPDGRLITCDRGYSFVVQPTELDAQVFNERLQKGEAALAMADDRAAVRSLRSSLCLWRGPALVDVQAGPILAVRLAGLDELRLSVLQKRIEADLRLGAHHELLSELRVLTGQYPLHENLHAQFMLALYRSGRQVDALQVFGRLRRVLGSELGLAPSPQISRLHEAMLASDPLLEAPARAAPAFALDLVTNLGRLEIAEHGKRAG